MAGAFGKQSSSRPIKYQTIAYNSVSLGTTPFGPSVQQIRVMSQLGGWLTINQTTNDTIIATTAGGVGMIISGVSTAFSAGTIGGGSGYPEYFAVTPGQIAFFSSTSTSTGTVSITEMG